MTTALPPTTRDELEKAVAGFSRIEIDRPELKRSAVALCVVVVDHQPCLVLTRRARTLRSHSGQWALPGGRRDPGESTTAAALRETAEEIGLRLHADDVLIELDDFATRTGYLMTPVVIWGGVAEPRQHEANAEVASVHYLPLVDLGVEPILTQIPQSPNPMLQLPLLGRYLHVPTGAIVHQFCELALFRRTTRVAHYEAPVAMWRR